MSSLYRALGGDAGIELLVDILYQRVLADTRIAAFFDGVDMNSQRRKFRSFLHTVSGGPQSRSGIELRSAHSNVVDAGLDESHVGVFAEHFRRVLDEAGTPVHVIDEVMARIDGAREDVLGR